MPRPPARPAGEKSTREQILDVALDLFVSQGFETTSLREIAEQMGFSKAALYYHFNSKDDLLMALHLRVHELGYEGFDELDSERLSPSAWPGLLDRFIDKMLDNRKLFLLHTRNHAAFEKLPPHEHEHADLEERFRSILTDESVPLALRVRLSCAIGAIVAGLFVAGEMFSDVEAADYSGLLRGAVHDLLEPVVAQAAV
jgi:AcrR family transcriptional regulator